MRKLINKSKNALSYTVNNRERYFLPIGYTLEVPEQVANVWLKHPGIEEIIDKVVEEVKPKKTKAKKQK